MQQAQIVKTTTTTLRWLSRPLIFALALILLIGAGFPTPTHAQNDPDTVWYWATTPEGLVAYTLDGDTSLVIEDRTLNDNTLFYGYRLTSDSALFRTATDFYWVEEARADTFPIDPFIIQNYMQPVDFSWPFVLFRDPEIVRPAALVNLETKSMEILSGNFIGPARFVSEVATFRYISSDVLEYSKRQVTLWERDLATGEEIPLITGNFDAALSSPDGLMWWWLSSYDNATRRYSKVQVVGDVSALPSEHLQWLVDNDATVIGAYLHHRLDHECQVSCEMVAYPLSGGQPINYYTEGNNYPHDFDYFSDESAIVSSPLPEFRGGSGSTLRLYESNSEVVSLGLSNYYMFGSDLSMTISATLHSSRQFSDNGLWAVGIEISDKNQLRNETWVVPVEYDVSETFTGQSSLLLWYLPYRGIVYKGPLSRSAWAAFDGDTALVATDNYPPILAWRTNLYYDTVVKTISFDTYGGQFYAPINGGKAIYRTPEGDLMLFTMEDLSLRMLVPKAEPVSIYDLQ